MKPGKKRLKQQRRINRLRARDNDTCCYCGVELDFSLAGTNYPHSPSIEHVHSQSDGGSDAFINSKLAHVVCNERVGDMAVAEKLAIMARHGHTSETPIVPRRSCRPLSHRQRFDQPLPPGTSIRVFLDKPGGWVKRT